LDEVINGFDSVEITAEAERLTGMLNAAQKVASDSIMEAKDAETYSKCFFVDGPGGSGKTFLYNTLQKTLQSMGLSVCAVTSTGFAATLLESGTTYHSRFGLGITNNETPTSKIKPTSKEALSYSYVRLL